VSAENAAQENERPSGPAPAEPPSPPARASRPLWRRLLRPRNLALELAALALLYAAYVLAGLPARSAVRALAKRNPEATGVMRQRDAEALAAGRKPRHIQSWVPLPSVSRNLIHAVIAAEDPNFFGHAGVDWEAMRESVEVDVKKGRFARGGSTITQQLAKNLFFSTRKSITRKLREFIVARWLEEDLSKRRILELYLNVIEWGDGVYGCGAAAQRYYGKSVGALDEVEAAGLAAMIPSPRRINPRTNPARYARAQRRVLRVMASLGYVKRQVGALGMEPPATVEEQAEEDESGPEPTEPPEPAARATPAEPATPPEQPTPVAPAPTAE
jgi:monofunctional biosynthetic peptidoglycan transglycosylase